MSYTPLEWKDGPQGGTPITAAALNRMEQGIVDAHAVIDAATPGAQANTLVLRDSNGRASVADPTSASHIATKGYVDASIQSHISGGSAVVAVNVEPRTINAQFTSTLIYRTERFDRLNEYNPTTGVFIANQSGWYLVTATLSIEIAPGSFTTVWLQSSGADNIFAEVSIRNPSASKYAEVVNLAGIIQLNAGQGVWVSVRNGSSNTSIVVGDSTDRLAIFRIA